MRRIRLGINGIGRIGKHLVRLLLSDRDFEVVLINDLNPDINNIAYALYYDTLFGKYSDEFRVVDNYLHCGDSKIFVANCDDLSKFDFSLTSIDYLIDATGVKQNLTINRTLIDQGVMKKAFVTHSPDEGVDFTMVLGCNERDYSCQSHHLIATSICDATAISPVLKLICDRFGIDSGYVTTLHPWLNYQNLMDGPSSSWSVPGSIHHHYALGRAAVGNLIPKPTSAMDAVFKVMPSYDLNDRIGSFSYRTPTAIVGSADITLNLSSKVKREDVEEALNQYVKDQEYDILIMSEEPLVSLDFVNNPYSAILDTRWLDIVRDEVLKMVLWYDNESGYARRVVDQIKFVESFK